MSYNDYFTRVEDLSEFNDRAYKKKITTAVYDKKSIKLFEDCFSNHVDYVSPEISELAYNHESNTRYIKRDILSSYFVNEIYMPPTITDCTDDLVIEYEIFINEFLECATSAEKNDVFQLGSNRIRYVVGDVGIGKSAFLKKLYSDIARKKAKCSCGSTYLQVYINLEEKYHYGIRPKPLDDSFLPYLFERIHEEVRSSELNIDISSINAVNPTINPLLAIKTLISKLKEENVSLVLYIDNLDFYHYFYARYSYFEKYNKNLYESINENILWLISIFRSSQNLGHLGLNVIMTLRDYVYDEAVAYIPGIATDIDATQSVKLSLPSEDVIISSRMKLLSDAIAVVIEEKPGAEKHLKEALNRLQVMHIGENYETGTGDNTPIKRIYKLGQHGYRSLVQFLSSLNISYLDHELLDRFFRRQVSTLYTLYYNKMHEKYAHNQNHFPNMFLVDCTIRFDNGFEDAHKPHMHTYWLKYFMLKTIVNKKGVKLNAILERFVTVGKYDDHLVRHVLGSLSTANEFRCAELDTSDVTKAFKARKVNATERGKMLFEKKNHIELCFEANYLNTIMDDQWLCYPYDFIDKCYKCDVSYSHLYEKDQEYRTRSIKHVLTKTRQSVFFCKILKAAYHVEIMQNKPELDAVFRQNNYVPNFNAINDNLIRSARKIIQTFAFESEYYSSKIDVCESIVNDSDIDSSLITFFDNYYSSDAMVSP